MTSSDEHLADLNPGFRKDSYRDAIFSKLEWQGQLASKVNATALLRGGDFFHVKPANKTTMGTLARAATIHRNYSCPTYAMAGNHDMSYNDPGTVPRQPLGVLLRSGVFREMRDERFVDGSMSVRVIGVEFTVDMDDEHLRSLVRKKDDDTYTVAFVHALAAYAPETRTQAFFNERIFDYRDLVFDGCPDVYVFGHYHKDQGVQEHLGVQFVNLGAVSRGALSFENVERVPKVSHMTFSSSGVSIDVHEIPCGDASEIFDMERKEQLEKERRSLDEFIKCLRRASAEGSKDDLDSLIEEFQNSDYPKDLQRLVLDTLEAAEHGVADL